MRETFGVPPVVPAEQRSRSRVPLWAWLFTAIGLAFMVTAAIVVERAVQLERSASRQRTAGPPFSPSGPAGPMSPSHRTGGGAAEACAAAAKRLESIAASARACGDTETEDALIAGRAEVILALETAHDDASKAEVQDACEAVLFDLPEFVCR